MEERLAWVNATMIELGEKVGGMDQRIVDLESKKQDEELREEMQGALNLVLDFLFEKGKSLEAMLVAFRDEMLADVEKLKVELNLCKAALANGGLTQVMATHKMDATKPKAYGRARSAREINNFLWNIERYFELVGIINEAVKVRSVSLYLNDVATIWWHRRCEDVKRGTCTIEDFKRELQMQFFPEDAENEARAKLHLLRHKEGYIREDFMFCHLHIYNTHILINH